ncbi:hypothetical protein FD755_006628 [Muntiacus reevesi]|uniref:Small ribosomal subunit protein eS4 central region domain-containing protein n=1 Tax=Muntiacus reevesi TaxID=9886 RepID=A0A5J5MVX3_MUNRE|nr:hypothetical protein FD755_006628 [Muntiacus reevesi]
MKQPQGPKKLLNCVAAPKQWIPHKLRECLPLIIFLRNRINGKVHNDIIYPAGFMDVISINETQENFCLIYDPKGRFVVHRITLGKAKYKLCKVRKIFVSTKGIPHLVTHDAHTSTGKITDFTKFDTRRIGGIITLERHPGSFDVVHVKDTNGNCFTTWLSNIFGINLTVAEERDKRLAARAVDKMISM